MQRNSVETGKEKVTVNETSAINDIGRFWDTIWSEEKDFNEKTEWIRMYKLTMQTYKSSRNRPHFKLLIDLIT